MQTSHTPDDVAHLKVSVRVKETRHGIEVECHPEKLRVRTNQRLLMLHFELPTGDYVFPEAGAIVAASDDPQFPLASWTEVGGLRARLLDYNTDNAEHRYTVNVVSSKRHCAKAFIQNGCGVD